MSDKYVDHITDVSVKKIWKRILDQVDTALRNHSIKRTGFLSPGEWHYSESVLAHYHDLHWFLSGGYKEAERKRLVMMPDYKKYETSIEPFALLRITHNSNNGVLSHRDYLGALLSQGIEREVVGDIIVDKQDAYVFLVSEMKDFIQYHLETVGTVRVQVNEVEDLPDHIKQVEMDIEKGTVASLRVDAVLAVAMRISRQKAQHLVNAQKVKVNWLVVRKSTQPLHKNDVISVNGYGRFTLLTIGELSRSRRWHIEVGKLK